MPSRFSYPVTTEAASVTSLMCLPQLGCDTGAAGPENWSAFEQSKYHPNLSWQVVEKYP